MPFDGIVAHATARELDTALRGGRIGKIQQPSRDTIVLQIRANGENHRLLVSSSGSSGRIQLTSSAGAENPASPPMFCMLLRKHLSGGIIRGVTCPGFERIVRMEVEVEDELGDRSIKTLVAEIMGRHSNIILLNRDEIILDSARHIDQDISRVREVLPAHPYILPPAQDKLDPSATGTPSHVVEISAGSDRKLVSFLLDHLRGFSPVLCREVCHMANLDPDMAAAGLSINDRRHLQAALNALRDQLNEDSFSPCTVEAPDGSRVLDYHAWTLGSTGKPLSHPTIGAALDAFYMERDQAAILSAKRAVMQKVIQQNLDNVQKRLAGQYATLTEHADHSRLQRHGELITANIHALHEGMETAEVMDYYSETGEMVKIPLDPTLSPQRNAQAYFRRYQKAKSACRYAKSQLDGLSTEATYLESLLYTLENATAPSDFSDIREEMTAQGYLKAPVMRPGKKGRIVKKRPSPSGNPPPAAPLHILSKDGFDIYIGRNNRQNDQLTLKSARPDDLWFHIKNFSGSHVVIRTEGKTIPEATLLEAASYAAWFSKARQGRKVEVDYTEIRNVRKPAGGKPGMVIYVQYHTIVTDPVEPKTTRE